MGDILCIVWDIGLLIVYLSIGAALIVGLLMTGYGVFVLAFVGLSVIAWVLVK